jgi:hypothetical protein
MAAENGNRASTKSTASRNGGGSSARKRSAAPRLCVRLERAETTPEDRLRAANEAAAILRGGHAQLQRPRGGSQ